MSTREKKGKNVKRSVRGSPHQRGGGEGKRGSLHGECCLSSLLSARLGRWRKGKKIGEEPSLHFFQPEKKEEKKSGGPVPLSSRELIRCSNGEKDIRKKKGQWQLRPCSFGVVGEKKERGTSVRVP